MDLEELTNLTNFSLKPNESKCNDAKLKKYINRKSVFDELDSKKSIPTKRGKKIAFDLTQ